MMIMITPSSSMLHPSICSGLGLEGQQLFKIGFRFSSNTLLLFVLRILF